MADTKEPNLPYGRQSIDDEDIRAVVDCLKGDWLTQGPRIEQFEKKLCEITGARFAIAVSSGTAALHLAALGLGIGNGDLGVVPAITFVASANCIRYAGGQVAFADVDPATALVDVSKLREQCARLKQKGTPAKLIVPVDMCGQPAYLPEIQAIAREYGAKVIEDAAHSLGATYTHQGVTFAAGSCAHTDAAILSFHPVKHVTTGEGGAVLTNDSELCTRIRDLRSHGIHRDPQRLTRKDQGAWYYEQSTLGFNYRITDLQCALGLSQLNKLDRFVARRREIAAAYARSFAQAPFAGKIKPLERKPGRESSWHLYVIRISQAWAKDRVADYRKDLFTNLREKNIFSQVHYIPVHWQPDYAGSDAYCSNADAYYAGCLSLPMFPAMTDADVQRVTTVLAEWLARKP